MRVIHVWQHTAVVVELAKYITGAVYPTGQEPGLYTKVVVACLPTCEKRVGKHGKFRLWPNAFCIRIPLDILL
jgi:hypothetical protein